MIKFQPNGLPALIGSLPITDHREAAELVFAHTPEIPLWVQLPAYPQEGMLAQFLPGMPGLSDSRGKLCINTRDASFDDAQLHFYNDYIAVTEGAAPLNDSLFKLTEDEAQGFFVFKDHLKRLAAPPVAVKGQITGPITFGTGVKDENDRSVFYNEQLRDMAVKLLALKAAWQAEQLAQFHRPIMIFFDEPALAGFGSSAFISISHEEVAACFEEVIEAVHARDALAGIHVCANADWSLILDSGADIVSFDAYSYFDKFILYAEQIKRFIGAGHILAWGIVPTLGDQTIADATATSLFADWEVKAGQITALGIDKTQLLAQSLITPSCGTGSLTLEQALKVLKLTQEVSGEIRRQAGLPG